MPTFTSTAVLARSRPSAATIAAVALLAGCGRPAARQSAADAATPASSGATVFADVTEPSGLDFTHQLANGKLDNIMQSDGSGGAILDYDGDGFMDVYLVNAGLITPSGTAAPAPDANTVSPSAPEPVSNVLRYKRELDPDGSKLAEGAAGTARLSNALFRNRGDGTFENVTPHAGLAGRGFGTTAAAADWDNDGHTDLLVVNFGELLLYRNRGDGTFEDVTARAGLSSTEAGISATFFDADNDGWLDLFVANYLVFDPAVKPPAGANVPYPGPLAYEPQFNRLYRNRGDGTFEDVSERAGVRIAGHRAMSVTPFDYDSDGDTDLYVSNDGTPNLLLANDGHGHFTDVALPAGVAFNQFGQADGSMGAVVGDVDGDCRPDILVTRFGKASLYLNSAGGMFDDRVAASGILNATSAFTGWGAALIDIDNDGDLDAFVAHGDPHYLRGSPSLLLENQGAATFADISARSGPFFARPLNLRGCGAFDFDNDGRIDLVLTALGERAILLHNERPSGDHWLTVKLVGTRSNRDGFGAQVRLVARDHTWQAEARCPTSYVFQQDSRLHFGLGARADVDRIEIRWPSGQTQVVAHPAVDQILRVQEP